MRVEVLVPQIGEAVAELVLLAWHKCVGDQVSKGDLLFEIDSEKAIVEVEAFVDGRLTEIIEPDESAVLPQQVVAIIESADAALGSVRSADGAGASSATPASGAPNRGAILTNSLAAKRQTARPNISPKARRLAKQAGIDWTNLIGSGADGLILVSDVEAAFEAKGL